MIRVLSENSITVYNKNWYKLVQIEYTEFYKMFVKTKNGMKQITTLMQSGSYFVDTKIKGA
jgi:hypothetical protein